MPRVSAIGIAVCLIGVGSVVPANATPITVNFGGTVVGSGVPIFPNGTAISGSYIYESSTPDTNASPTVGQFNAVSAWSVTVGATTFAATGGQIQTDTGSPSD